MEIVFYFSWMEFSFCHRVNLLFTTHWKTFWGKIVIYAPLTSWSQFDRQRPLFLRSKHHVKMTGHSQVGHPTLFLHLFFIIFISPIQWAGCCFPFFSIINFYSIFSSFLQVTLLSFCNCSLNHFFPFC